MECVLSHFLISLRKIVSTFSLQMDLACCFSHFVLFNSSRLSLHRRILFTAYIVAVIRVYYWSHDIYYLFVCK